MSNDHDPATLEEIMNGSPFDLIDSPFSEGKMERWRASTMATGTMGMLKNVYDMVRADATIADARADAIAARDAEIRGQIVKLITGLDTLTARVDSIEAKDRAAKADAARQAAFDEEPLTLPPDITDYQARNPPAEIKDDKPPSEEPEPTLAELEDPDLEIEDDQAPSEPMPKEIEDPTDPVPEPRGKVQPQPVSISLNKE